MMNWLRYGILAICVMGWFGASLDAATAAGDQRLLYPSVDERVVIARIAEDQVEVEAPYLFHQGRYKGDVDTLAEWACQLYRRTAVSLSFSVSNQACDTMGSTAAKRDPGCWHTHLYACALP